MFEIFTRDDKDYRSIKTYPMLRYVYENINHNIRQVKKFAIDLNYKPDTTSVIEKLINNYCPNPNIDDDYFYEIVKECSDDWCRALGINYIGNIGKCFKNDLHRNGDEFYVLKESDFKLMTFTDRRDKINFLLNMEPLKVLYTSSNFINYEFRQKFLDISDSYIVMELDPVLLFMGYKYWCSILNEEDSRSPFRYITKFVMPNMIKSRTKWQLLNIILDNAYLAKSRSKLPYDIIIQRHKFDFKLLDITTPLNKAITEYYRFIYNRRLVMGVYINSMPFIEFDNEDQSVLEFLRLSQNLNFSQTRWIKWSTRCKLLLSMFELLGENGKACNREFFTGFKYEMEQYKHNGVQFPKDTDNSTLAKVNEDFDNMVTAVYGENYNPGEK